MTVEIDDSGTGEIVGSAYIGIHQIKTGKMVFKELNLHLFDDYGWDMKIPKFKAIEMIKNSLEELNYNKNEIIHLCQGNFFDMVRIYLRDEKITYKNCSIKGILQKSIEEKYILHLEKIGFKIKSEYESKFLKDYKFRNRCLTNWVCKDYKNRLKYVKVGFKKGFNRLLDRIQKKHEIDRDDILEYHIQDSIYTLKRFCEKKNYHWPCYYYYIDDSWQKDNHFQHLFLEKGKSHLVGVSIREKTSNQKYLENFDLEQKDKKSLNTIGKGSGNLARDAKLRASAKICDILNLKYKRLEESNY